MPQLRKDPVIGRWVIVNVESPRAEFPAHPHEKSSKVCPFCPGNEAMTPPAIATYHRPHSGQWQVRVVPNKFPALRIEEAPERNMSGIYERMGGFGAHEVIIENPDHRRELPDLSVEEIMIVLRAYRDRCLDLRNDKRIRYILLFKNYGPDAGASLEHPHSQLIGLPIVPSRVMGEVQGSADHFSETRRCVYCAMLEQEKTGGGKLTVCSGEGFAAIAPFAARFPFETWIMPVKHSVSFDSLQDGELAGLARCLQKTLAALKIVLGDPSYNFMIHTSPLDARESDAFHWHIEVIPHLTEVAGFELGTGFYVNPTPAEVAADKLRKAGA